MAGSSLATVLMLALGVASAGSEPDAPILALLPFDGPADPGSKPDRVVMLVKDHERLEFLARPEEPQAAGVTLVSASHKVGRDAPGLVAVEGTYEVEVVGTGPASWTLPVGATLELSAEVDGRPCPLAIATDGLSASLPLDGAGLHRLRFRRLARLSAIGGGERVRIPINRAAFAGVVVAREAGPSWVEVVGATGGLATGPAGIEGGLGPLDVLEVRWFAEDRPPSAGLQGPVEATFLWDARPAGDLIRLRLVHSDTEGASDVRIAMAPGVVVRRHSIPDVVSIRREGTEARPEWVARVDPPWPKDAPIEVDFWRPSAQGSDDRVWPEIDFPTAGKTGGLIGFRRPSDWSGRLEPGKGIEPASELGFAKAWGVLPDDGLALAGAVRYGRSSAGLAVETRPVPSRRSIRTRVAVEPAPGRLDTSIEAVLTDRQGRSFDLQVAIPVDLRVIRVEADGLVDWRRVGRDQLRLQFDGSEAPERKIRIEAYVPAPADSPMTEARNFQARVPWPRWGDAEALPGTIEVVGPTRFPFEPGEGVVAITPAGPAAEARSTYRVDPPAGPSTVRWAAPPARVNVAVDSELAIDPTSMTWTADLTCEVSGGPASTLNLSLPTEWAAGASLEIEGLTHRLSTQPKGPKGETTQWTISPDSPIWGRARLILRSRRPLPIGREFAYPQVAPLATTGRGSVGRYDLTLANGSGRSMEIAGSSGLQPVDASRFRGLESSSARPMSRSIDHAYHVTGERWSLRLKVGRAGDEGASPLEGRDARVAFAQLACVIDADGSTWGRARFDLEPRPGPFLAVRLPEPAEIPWASVDGAVVPASPDGPGRWLIPLGDRSPSRVVLAWHCPCGAGAPGSRRPLALPALDRPAPTALIRVDGPEGLDLAVGGEAVERIGRAAWEVGHVEPLARGVVEAMGDLDRGSRRDREAILADLTEIELRVRRIARLPDERDDPADPAPVRLQAALNSIAEATQSAGLDDLIQEARARVGVAQPPDDLAEGLVPSPPEVVRLRRSGGSHFFRATAGDARRPPAIAWAVTPAGRRWGSADAWAIVGAGLGFWIAIGGLIAGGVRPSGRLAWGIALVGSLALLAWEPAACLAILGLGAWGRITR